MGLYRLKREDLASLRAYEVKNPHYSSAAPMQLYLLSQIENLTYQKWGSSEPYIVSLTELPPREITWLLADPIERLKHVGAKKFQYIIADRLERMGMSVQLVGDVYSKDGGVDIIAYPSKCAIPFILAIQAKHHHTDRKTSVVPVRDLHGVLTSQTSDFHLGLIVTNTSFTAHAKWFADHNKRLLRLRDIDDLCRWLRNDFVNEFEWREIPNQIELAPGVKITLVKQRIWMPDE
jgi:Restriction endonuclease/XPA protein C-terminus